MTKNNDSSLFGNLKDQVDNINKNDGSKETKKSNKKTKKSNKKTKKSNKKTKKSNKKTKKSNKKTKKSKIINKTLKFIEKTLNINTKKLRSLDKEKIKSYLKELDSKTVKKRVKKNIAKAKKINYKKRLKIILKTIKKQKKYLFGIVLFIVIIEISLLTKSFLTYNGALKKLEESTDQLKQLNTYEEVDINQNYLNNQIGSGTFFKTFYETQIEHQILEEELSNLQSPYNNFLRELYLPSLNIRKDPINEEINTELIGQNYLQNNKFIDTQLINKWSSFFNMNNGLTDSNEIEDIDVGDFESVENIGGDKPLFKIPIKTTLISPSRRTFLATTNKLATTSRKESIGLINEFFYYLLESLRNNKKINSIATKQYQKEENNEKNKSTQQKIDKIIFNNIYKRALQDQNNEITNEINSDMLYKIIQKTANCPSKPKEHNNTEIEECLFNFREKYQNIGSLKKIATTNSKPNPKELKNFIKNLPPALNISHFSFRQANEDDIENDDYNVEIEIEIFGTDIENENIKTISNKLWTKCYPNKEKTDNNFINKSIAQIENEKKYILKNIGGTEFSSTKLTEIQKLLNIFNQKKKEFDKYEINYNKAIDIFEVYRMLNENGYCN